MNTSVNNLRWLLIRETMEHRKLLLAGVWLGVVLVVLNLLFTAGAALRDNTGTFSFARGHNVTTLEFGHSSGTNLSIGLGNLGAGDVTDLAQAVSFAMQGILALFALALGASVLSFGLSCLFDERRDRSVLFWKSMPTTDGQTVAAKFIFGLILLPLVWVAAALATGWLVMATYALAIAWSQGDVSAVFAHTQLLTLTALVLASLPVYLLTLVPALAWTMACSATARRHPAVIAFIVPAMFALLGAMGWPNPVWHLLIGRLFPIGLINGLQVDALPGSGWARIVAPVLSPLADPQLWLGVLFGAACLAAAVWYRRRYTVLV